VNDMWNLPTSSLVGVAMENLLVHSPRVASKGFAGFDNVDCAILGYW
jgi:hypothetical protein